jgi:hypothetical protein
MIRQPKIVTKTCHTCHRPGWTRTESYALYTEEEQRHCHGRQTYSKELAAKGLVNTELCDASAGSDIGSCIREGIDIAMAMTKAVAFEFNGKIVFVGAFSDPDQVYRKWWQDVYGETPEESFAKR